MTKCAKCGAESEATAGSPCECGGTFIRVAGDGGPRIIGLPTDLVFRTYIGDGVYAAIDHHGQIVLTAENGIRVTNIIYLEPSMLKDLTRWVHARQEEL